MWLNGEQKKIKELKARAEIALATPENVPSPCVSVCVMHTKTGFCQGCWRTISEIAGWSGSGDASKRQVWQHILLRLQPLQKS
jgi:predicted Fe-S protein YdhL (DUF1289 family)